MLRKKIVGWLSAALLLSPLSVWAQAAAISETVETLTTREDYTQTFTYMRVREPIATLVVYPGYQGYVGIFPNGSMKLDKFVVVRARRQFAEMGFNVVVLDAPSEYGARGIWDKQRSPEYVAHNAAVLEWLRKRESTPIYLVGFTSGAIAAAGVATQLAERGADGLVLLSPWMASKEKWPIPNFVFKSDFAISSWTDLAKIRGPILIVRNADDTSCKFTLPEYLDGFVAALSVAGKPEVVTLSGGASASGDPCYPDAHTNFNGLEAKLVQTVRDWALKVKTAAR